jgi:hypothetical protein
VRRPPAGFRKRGLLVDYLAVHRRELREQLVLGARRDAAARHRNLQILDQRVAFGAADLRCDLFPAAGRAR